MGLLQPYDEPITKEFLFKEGFSTRLNSDQIDMRYDLANMSRDEYADMIESNIFYEKNVIEHDIKHSFCIRIKYWPDSYHTDHYVINSTVLHTIANVYKNTDTSMNELNDIHDSIYNLEVEFLGRSFLYMAPMRSRVLTTREFLDFIALADVKAEESKKLHDKLDYSLNINF
jgi:hypothetical protein